MNRRYFFGTAIAGLALARTQAAAANEKVNIGMDRRGRPRPWFAGILFETCGSRCMGSRADMW